MRTDGGYSGHAATGSKYDNDKWRSAAEIAKGIRMDIKDAIARGDLPGKTHRLGAFKYSVRSQSFAGGQSVSINVIGPDDGRSHEQWAFRDVDVFRDVDDGFTTRCYTDEALRIGRLLNQIGNAYTYRDVDSQIDYFHVTCYINVYCGTSGLCL